MNVQMAALLVAVFLVGCGGGDPAPAESMNFSDRMRATGVTPGSPITVTSVTADMTLDWAEYKFPELFPKALGEHFPTIDYLGVMYNARAYSGAWGVRYLGITPEGKVYGLGDFTGEALQQFDDINHWSSQILSDKCVVYPQSCINSVPVANAGPQQNVVAGTTVALDGSASTDANGDQLTYSWSLTSKPAGSAAALAVATSAKPTFTADLVGTYIVSLTVYDGRVHSAVSTVTVTAAAANLAPIANPGTAQKVTTGTLVTLDGSASSDANGDHLTYSWSMTSKPAGSVALLASSTTAKPTFISDVVGLYELTLVVSDGKVGSNSAKVIVEAVQVTSPADGKVTTRVGENSGAKVVLIQPDGKIVAVGSTITPFDTDIALVRYNRDGGLDTSFAGRGTVITNIAGRMRSTEWVRGAVSQPDGKILVAGYTATSGDPAMRTFLARYNQNGSLDPSFGGRGFVTTDGDTRDLMANCIVLQSDGKIIVGGTTNLFNRGVRPLATLLLRYNNDGSLDETFGYKGVLIDSSTLGAQGIALQTDGKIVIVGSQEYYGNNLLSVLAVARYNNDGSVDSTFAGSGVVYTEVGTQVGSNNSGSSVAIQPDGKILAGGSAYSPTSNNDFALVRYNINGSVDWTFGWGGQVTTDFGEDSDLSFGIAVQSDGKILMVGQTYSVRSNPWLFPGFYIQSRHDLAVTRYSSNGSLDTNFGSAGTIRTSFGDLAHSIGYSLALQSDGSIVAAGTRELFFDGYSIKSHAVTRYKSSGTLDPSFRER